jgi:gamma-glutamylcyclotransferase (GGCT)/AIG2-like uncharacterized protein YtfP
VPAPSTTLFAYGSLMFPEVWWHVVGRERRSAGASLGGFRALTAAGYTFPGLVPWDPAALTPGRLYFDLDAKDWQRLDDFEDTFYQRQTVTAETADGSPVEAEAYVVMPERAEVLSDTIWTPEWFEKNALADFVDRITGFGPADG